MTDLTLRVLQTFETAKRVNHYYWVHTPADKGDRISVENLQRIVERMTRLPVQKRLVHFSGGNVRGNFERYADKIIINIRADQPIEWKRATVVKELCHALNDDEEEYSVTPDATIRGVVESAGLLDENHSPTTRSEWLAELLAKELIYPIEFREADLAAMTTGLTLAQIVQRRHVPSPWVQRAIGDKYLAACKQYWEALADVKLPDLAPL
jgi:Zn-dependent peptidase ImmA (M78 family)